MKEYSFHQKIFEINYFKKQYIDLILSSVKATLPSLGSISDAEQTKQLDWNYLLLCASILSQSNKSDCQDAALRIAQHCLKNPLERNYKSAAALILDRLSNYPAIRLAINKQYLQPDYQSLIPLPFLLERTRRSIDHTLLTAEGTLHFLNKFQRDVYEKARDYKHLSITAKTSTGKSFILNTLIVEKLLSGHRINIAYVVPSRALINQVESEFQVLFNKLKFNHVYLSSIPRLPADKESNKSVLFIFTQERLLWFRNDAKHFPLDLIIVDEAQKIQDGTRGILLQSALEDIIKDFPDVSIYFSSAYSYNPEILLEGIIGKKSTIKSDYAAVNQNLITVSQVPRKPIQCIVNLHKSNHTYELGLIKLKHRPTSKSRKYAFISYALSDFTGGNIIYVNGAADAENLASILSDLIEKKDFKKSKNITELIKLVKSVVHKKYALARVLEKGVAFHYGNMPQIIRNGIEDLFKEGDIRYLICTSTLLEGVNLPAKSIFMMSPTRGRNKPLTESDFWNLAGRAGRLGKEFQGNIICISPEIWKIPPPKDSVPHKIKRAVDEVSAKEDRLINFIKNDAPRKDLNDNLDLEYAFSYYFNKFIRGTIEADETINSKLKSALIKLFEDISEKVSLPSEIILKNIGISPLAQQNLFNYFMNYREDIINLIPALPEEQDALNNYIRIIARINKHFSGEPPILSYPRALLVLNWIRGLPLSRIIELNFNYWRTKKKLPEVIRSTMKDIDEYARFKFAKYSTCYIDILRYFLATINKQDLLDAYVQRLNLNIWLELGVSTSTQTSLIELGCSRSTAIQLSEHIADDQLDRNECLSWLQKTDIGTLGLSDLMFLEIARITRKLKA